MKENENTKCDPCEQQFEDGVKEIVDQVEGYSRKEHDDKEKEVDAAFQSGTAERK